MELETVTGEAISPELVDSEVCGQLSVETTGESLSEDVYRIAICPFRGHSSKSTIEDESEWFPKPVDPLKRLAEVEDVPIQPKRSIAQLYAIECRKYGVTALQLVCGILEEIEREADSDVDVDLNRVGLSNLQVQIILDCLAVACPDRLNFLGLSHNLLMDSILANCLANLLQLSRRIARLDLSHCTLSDYEVLKILADALSTSTVRSVNLSHCQLSDTGGVDLFNALSMSDCIEEVDVSWNRLQSGSGVAAGLFVGVNSTIRELNLEGNYLYREKECIVPFLKELAKNESLRKLNLSWNALRGSLFGSALVKAIVASGLKVLNLEMNCLRSEEALSLLKAFRKCEHLREILLGGNFFSEDDLKEFLKAFGRNPNMNLLSLGKYQFVSKVTGRLSKRFMNRDPSKRITYQGVLLANPPRPVDVPEMLLDRCRFLGFKPKKKKLKRDLGHFMLQLQKLENPLLPRDDFLAMVKKFRIKLDKSLTESLMDAFTERKLVDGAAMAVKYLDKYPTEPPPVKPKKSKGKKKKKKGIAKPKK
ncbi:uncharacterized protein LOC135697360 [Ochlerotatus camptorhynchus]|uniref:uncharacterized protein LOC135697360 n=1 Tax=Ochlerotatus camptorhynchus TaxID=644619 RepID=UPI0031CFCFCA